MYYIYILFRIDTMTLLCKEKTLHRQHTKLVSACKHTKLFSA